MYTRTSWAALGAVFFLTMGCASRQEARDAAAVERLSQAASLPAMAGEEPDLRPSVATERLLGDSLSLDEAARLAISSNRELRAMFREIGVARGDLIQARLLPNPTVEVEILPERESQLELRLEYELTEALLTKSRASVKEPGILAARLRTAATVVETGARAKIAYFVAQAAQQRLHLAQEVLSSFAAQRDAADALGAAGNVPDVEVVERHAAFERARLTVAELEVEAQSAHEALVRVLGVHGDQAHFRIPSDLPEVPELEEIPEDVESKAIETNLELRASSAHLESLSKNTRYVRLSGAVPDVEVDLHALRRNPNNADAVQAESDWRFGGGVSVPLPVFDRKQGLLRRVESSYDAALERHIDLATRLRSEAREVRARLLGAHRRALHFERTVIPSQDALMRQILLQYNAMQLSVFELIRARRAQLEMELARIDAELDYWTAREELSALLQGGRLGTPLSRGNEQSLQLDAGGHDS